MLKHFFRKMIIFIVLIVIIVVAVFGYANSKHAGKLVAGRLSNALGDKCRFKNHSISWSGDVKVEAFEVLSSTNEPILSAEKIDVEQSWWSLVSGDVYPDKVNAVGISAELSVQNGSWNLATLNKRRSMPLGTDFFVKIDRADVILEKKATGTELNYKVNTLCQKVYNSFSKPLTNISFNGEVGVRQLTVDQLSACCFDGTMMVTGGAVYSFDGKQLLVDSFSGQLSGKELNISSLSKLAGEKEYKVDGELSVEATFSGGAGRGLLVQSSLTSRDMTFQHSALGHVLRRLKYPESFLVFKEGEAELIFSGDLLTVKRAGLYNRELVTIKTENSTIEFQGFRPGRTFLPLNLSAPYKVVKVKELRSDENPDLVEVELNIRGQAEDVPSLIQDEVLGKVASVVQQKASRELERLNKKLNIKIGGKELDVNSIIDIFKKSTK